VNSSLNDNVDPIVFTGFSQARPEGNNSIEEFLDHKDAYAVLGVKYVLSDAKPENTTKLLANGLTLDYDDQLVRIFKIPDAKAYYSGENNNCSLGYISRDKVNVSCHGPSKIVRRELYAPGWRAVDQNGNKLAIVEDGPLFQAVNVGRSTKSIEFSYLPPHEEIGIILFVGSVAITLAVILSIKYDWPERLTASRRKD
jgi:hypothetical protein